MNKNADYLYTIHLFAINAFSASFVILFILLSIFFVRTNHLDKNFSVNDQANLIFDTCKGLSYKEECYADEFGKLTKKTNMDFAKQTLLSLQDIDPVNSIGCHLIAHTIAISQVEKAPGAWMDLLRNQDFNFCTGGFLHGILEAHNRTDSNFRLTAKEFNLICSQVKDKGVGMLSCNHNLGHILLAQEGGNIDRGIAVCDKIPNYSESFECLSGLFMENLTRLNLVVHGIAERIPWDEENTREIEKLCLRYRGDTGRACWKEISYMYITINNADPVGLFNSCKRAPSKEMQDQCYIYGAGNMVVFSTFDEANLNEVCKVYKNGDPLYKTCIFQIIGSQMASSHMLSANVTNICDSTFELFKKDCFDYFSRTLSRSVINVKDKINICKNLPDDFRDNCVIQVI